MSLRQGEPGPVDEQRTTRRAVLRLGRDSALAAAGLWLSGCSGGRARPDPPAPAGVTIHMVVSRSFARLALALPPVTPRRLASTPALAALVRHQRMMGNVIKPGALLTSILKKKIDIPAARTTLEAWRGRDSALLRYARAAKRYMPPGIDINGTIFFVTGYDIGVASPPDVAINIAHPRFLADPAEVGHYVTHEVHHLGFMARQRMPSLRRMEQPTVMATIIKHMTQMEGMAVHAAYPVRAAVDALEADADYGVYRHKEQAKKTIARYADIMALTKQKGPLSRDQINTILGAMSSGERLWYRFGALVARRVEREHGRAALARTIDDPSPFHAAAAELLSGR